VTVSVEHRLAPGHRFPAAVHDCYAATCWVAEHAADLGVDPARLAVGGDSADGNLSAAVTLLARGGGGPRLRHQLPVYPNTDQRADTASLRESEDPLLFNHRNHYLAEEKDGLNPLASPLRAAGVPVEARRYDGMVHGFFLMPGMLDPAGDAAACAAARPAGALGRG
jgi:acetyl esterase/lipase